MRAAGGRPMTSVRSGERAGEIASELAENGVKAVRLLFADLHGVARGKDIPIGSFPALAADGVAFCAAVLATDLRQTPVVEDDASYGDMLARPDLETLRIVPWQPEVAWCVADLWSPDGSTRWPACPRGALAAVAGRCLEAGFTPVVGPELEFFLLEHDADTDSYAPMSTGLPLVHGRIRLRPARPRVEMLAACDQLGRRR